MCRITIKHFHYLFFSIFIIIQVFFLLFNESTYGGADNITHYQIAKYSFKYPELFFDLWGKPVYTTFLAPFTLFGFRMAKAFNLLVAVFTLFISSKIADRLYPGSSIYTIILIAFSPLFFFLSISCLTEIVFSLVLVLAVWFFLDDHYYLSASVISFIPFVRSEGIILLLIFAMALVLKRTYRSVLFLMLGTVFYFLAGYFVFGDILWIVNKFPYTINDSIYGSGSLLHFVEESINIFGIPFLFLLVPGLIIWLYEIIRDFSFKKSNLILFILITGSWVAYFAAHSYVWWKGMGGSLGLIRVMGGIIPLAAFTGMKTFAFVRENVKNRKVVFSIFSIIAVIQIIMLFARNDLPIKKSPTEQIIEKATDNIRFNQLGAKVFYFDPLVVHNLEIDPYDINKCNWGIADKNQPSNSMKWGDIIIWDAHFGQNEGGVSMEVLNNDPYLKKLKSIYPVEKITVLGGYDYSVQIFKKSKEKNDSLVITDHYEKILSFEDYINDEVKRVDGFNVWRMDEHQEFSPNVILSPREVNLKGVLEFNITVIFETVDQINKDEILLVLSVEDEGKNLHYEKLDMVSSGNVWEDLKMNIKMSANIPYSSEIGVYIWNIARKEFYLKELKVQMLSY